LAPTIPLFAAFLNASTPFLSHFLLICLSSLLAIDLKDYPYLSHFIASKSAIAITGIATGATKK